MAGLTSREWLDPSLEVDLANRIRSGDKDAFEEFVAAFSARLMHYSLFVCRQREDAEEVVQDTLLALYGHLGELRDAAKLRPWAFRVAKNVCLMKRRKAGSLPPSKLNAPNDATSSFEIADWSAAPNLRAEYGELTGMLHAAIQELPEDHRTVFLLRSVENLSTEEVAYALEISIDVVKTRLKRARAAIREMLNERSRAPLR